MPKTRCKARATVCATAKAYKRKVTTTMNENLTEAQKKGNRLIRRASLMVRVDPLFHPASDQAGPFANFFIMQYEFPTLEKPNATDLSSLCSPTEILMPRIQNLEFLCYGCNATQGYNPQPDPGGWFPGTGVGSCFFATLRDPVTWYDDYKNAVTKALVNNDLLFNEASAARELLMIWAKPFAIRNDKVTLMRQYTNLGIVGPQNNEFISYQDIDSGKMFQCKYPQSMQTSKIWFGIMAPGMFGQFRRCDAQVWINIDYDYEKINMEQYFWLQTQDPDSIFSVYNDSPEAKVYGPMPIAVDFQDNNTSAAAYAYSSEGVLTPVLVYNAETGNAPPHVSSRVGKIFEEKPLEKFQHNEKDSYQKTGTANATTATATCTGANQWKRDKYRFDLTNQTQVIAQTPNGTETIQTGDQVMTLTTAGAAQRVTITPNQQEEIILDRPCNRDHHFT